MSAGVRQEWVDFEARNTVYLEPIGGTNRPNRPVSPADRVQAVDTSKSYVETIRETGASAEVSINYQWTPQLSLGRV